MDSRTGYRPSGLRDRNRAQRAATTRSYPVNAIIDHRFRQGMVLYYLLEWSPMGRSEDSWEHVYNLSCDRLIIAYWEKRALAKYERESHEVNIDPSMAWGHAI